MKELWPYFVAGTMSWALTGLLRRYAITKSLIDLPNERSSHEIPTPRGGGMAFVFVFLCSSFYLYHVNLTSTSFVWALVVSGVIVAITGFWDDHKHIAAQWRLLIHFLAAAWGLFCLNGVAPIIIFDDVIDLKWVGHGLGLLFLVWLINLYNFMDGIDGIAGLEAITVCVGAAVLDFLGTPSIGQWQALLLLAVTVAGFLAWNFPLAKIFMGDAGSGFLGIVLGLFFLQAAWISPNFFWSWLILLGVFIVDATLTLWRRYLHGEVLHEAHRIHAYQHAARFYKGHKPVSLGVAAINICWLAPLSLCVSQGYLDGVVGLVIAYSPLIWLAFHFNAGERTNGQ